MKIGILGVPVDLGQDRRGVDMGPSAIRYAGLNESLRELGHEVFDRGDVRVPHAEVTPQGTRKLKYVRPIARMAKQLADGVSDILDGGCFPLVLGGDHSLSLGSLAGVARNRSVGVIWLDAHGDFNTDVTSPSGNIHGMVLAALAGYGDSRITNVGGFAPKVRTENIVLVGVRSLDPPERDLLRSTGALVFTMHEVDRMGMPAVMEAAIAHAGKGVTSIHVSLDLDVVDPMQAPGVGTPVHGGLTYRETHLAVEMLASCGKMGSLDVVEVNPILDTNNETARLAVAFVLSAMGKRIM